MVHPGLVSCSNSMEKSISFTSMTVQMLLTNRLPCTLVIVGQPPWDAYATHFPVPEAIMDNIVRRAVIHVEFYGNFIKSDSPVFTDSLLDLLFHCLSRHANWSPSLLDLLFHCLSYHANWSSSLLDLLFHCLSCHANWSPSLLDLLFHCLSCHANWSPSLVFITDVLSTVLKSFHPFTHSPLTQTTVSIVNLHSSVDFRRFHNLGPQKTNNASLLFHVASWQSSGHVVRPIAQAHTARSSRLLYGILLRSNFVSRNKIFSCAYFSMKYSIKFLLFNDFLS
jgi:hypothetical protein